MTQRKWLQDRAVAGQRVLEQQRRAALARSRAKDGLAKLYPEDYRRLYQQAKIDIRTERGPLPGDDA